MFFFKLLFHIKFSEFVKGFPSQDIFTPQFVAIYSCDKSICEPEDQTHNPLPVLVENIKQSLSLSSENLKSHPNRFKATDLRDHNLNTLVWWSPTPFSESFTVISVSFAALIFFGIDLCKSKALFEGLSLLFRWAPRKLHSRGWSSWTAMGSCSTSQGEYY